MSGTSADAIDVAIVDIRGRGWNSRIKFRGHSSIAYPSDVRARILAIAGGSATTAGEISQLNFLIGELFAKAFVHTCRQLGIPAASVKLLGSHGQTVHHQPKARREAGIPIRSTLQLGEPSAIAARTGVPTVADFRTADMAIGGQGAPLVPFFDYLQYRHRSRGRVVLNIGGIANITVIPSNARPGAVIAFDTGPGNMVIDQLVFNMTKGRVKFDAGGKRSAAGTIDESLLKKILREPYFAHRPPKSTGREMYGPHFLRHWFPVAPNATEQEKYSTLATATALTAATIVQAIQRFALPLGDFHEVLVSGGGVKNSFLMDQIQARMEVIASAASPLRICSLESAPIPSEAKEAAAFALLAYQTKLGIPSNLPSVTGATRQVVLGKLVSLGK
jgi:anhydro-N-acetylmuramic acid kinase